MTESARWTTDSMPGKLKFIFFYVCLRGIFMRMGSSDLIQRSLQITDFVRNHTHFPTDRPRLKQSVVMLTSHSKLGQHSPP